MSRSSRFPPQLIRESWPDSGHEKDSDLATLDDIHFLAGACDDDHDLKAEWERITENCEALLTLANEPSSTIVDDFGLRLSRIVYASFRLGTIASFRGAAAFQSERARAAKKRKADLRGQIIRRAVVSVCQKQRVAPVASQKFAHSIRHDVLEAAAQLGLVDAHSGTSARSIQRHIAALLKDARM